MAIRTASVDDKTATLIDNGARLDQTAKNVALELQGTKAILCNKADFEADEKSVRLEGTKACAVVSKRIAYELKLPNDEAQKEFEGELSKGKFANVVKAEVKVNVSTERLGELVMLLDQKGFTFGKKFKVDPKGFKAYCKEVDSPEVLANNVREEETMSVKFEIE